MPTESELLALLEALRAAPPCAAHGRQRLRVCAGCLRVDCQHCAPRPCPCGNDE